MSKQNKEQRRDTASVERRAVGELLEVRAAESGKKKVTGYALKWNQRYNMGWFTEEISREALSKADLTDVRALLNHDPNFVLGRTTAGTLSLTEDEVGLRYEIDLPDTQAGRDLATSIDRGDISQSSWGFTLRADDDATGDEWSRQEGKDHRTITAVRRVFDVSPVTFPANPDTDVARRHFDAIQTDKQQAEKAKTDEQEILTMRSAQIRATLAQYPNK